MFVEERAGEWTGRGGAGPNISVIFWLFEFWGLFIFRDKFNYLKRLPKRMSIMVWQNRVVKHTVNGKVQMRTGVADHNTAVH